MNNQAMDNLVIKIREIMESSKQNLIREVNFVMLHTYWQIGHIIVEHEQNGELKAQYGTKLLVELSKRLTKEIGKGYSRSNLYSMREFYWGIQFSRRRLENCLGRIISNFYQ